MKRAMIFSLLVGAAVVTLLEPTVFADSRDGDTMNLNDEPGNWFKSEKNGTSVTVINPGQEIDFVIGNKFTDTRHTVTLLVKPVGSKLKLDQGESKNGKISATFDVPGVYVIICKIHPFMTAVVAVKDAQGNIPDVTAASLPFIAGLGVPALPAATVLSVLLTVAATDADKAAKWDIRGPADQKKPSVPGIGHVWVNTQFERVKGQTNEHGVLKPGTITVVDAETFTVKSETNGLKANGLWNNPHNLWANFKLDTMYNTNWFGKWINKIDRVSGDILQSITVGEAPTHIVTIPTPGDQFGVLTIPLSADNDLVKVEDGPQGLKIISKSPTGDGKTHPHGHWLTCGDGDRAVVPNVFKGIGTAGSISIMDTSSGRVLKEFLHDPNDPLRNAIQMPIAVGECHVNGVHKAYVANAASGFVTVINVDTWQILAQIPVTKTPDGQLGQNILSTLQVPIQVPVSPDERFVAVAVLSLTNVRTAQRPSPDHVAIIDTHTDQVVAFVPSPLGTHGANWGAKLGGGYYAHVTAQFANVLTVVDPDPNGDGSGQDAAAVGTIILANGSAGAGVTDGTGGQGVKPLPMTHDGWIQPTVNLVGTGQLSAEVEAWIKQLTPQQKNPVRR